MFVSSFQDGEENETKVQFIRFTLWSDSYFSFNILKTVIFFYIFKVTFTNFLYVCDHISRQVGGQI